MNDKIHIPTQLRLQVLMWYHEMLIHPGQKCLELTLCQHLTQPGLTADIKQTYDTCHLYKICKSIPNNYGHLPPKNINDNIPQRTICVDLIGSYQITDGTGVDYKLQAITMIDPATGWFEIVKTHTKTAEHISKLLDRTWFSYYPQLQFYIFDNSNEFLGEKFKKMIEMIILRVYPQQ